ncbi:uncharacterized protein LOC128264103 [Drosophila gunungcola]|uniref:Single domain-containing protein n=1 Tax=Drosophila gunungcola TaxID=103775 RepID=A0A9P9YE06_9MUSC|nr:uncharacterized protein LOC128264103 [Drosophila gunungcola]KAI8034793.1 hypothetical protein M5D96_012457 [Drosophila gunungcola]
MSRFTIVTVLFVSLAVILAGQGAQAAVAKVQLTNPDHPGKCVLDSNTIMSPGEVGKQPNHPCASAECHAGGLVTIRTCAAVAPPKGCKQRDFVNTNRSFPECCERAYDCSKHI